MFAAVRQSLLQTSRRGFSSSSTRMTDLAKLTLIGRLGKAPEAKMTRNGKEYYTYTVGTTNTPPPPKADGTRDEPKTSWHSVMSFNQNSNAYLQNLTKGSLVYVEANYEVAEADPLAETGSPQSSRQVFLRHENIKVLKRGQERMEESLA